MPTAEERMHTAFYDLLKFAGELATSWTNGNRTDVMETLTKWDDPALALLVAHCLLDDPSPSRVPIELGRKLFEYNWTG